VVDFTDIQIYGDSATVSMVIRRAFKLRLEVARREIRPLS